MNDDDKKAKLRDIATRAADVATPVQQESKPSRRLVVQTLADIIEEKPTWIWRGWVPRRAVSILGGKGGGAKGLMLCDLVARLTRGDVMPDGSGGGSPGRVLIIAREDDASTLKARLRIAGADMSRVHVSTGDIADADDVERAAESMRDAAPEIEAAAVGFGVDWVIIDPIGAWIEDDGNSSAQVRAVIDPMTRICQRIGIAVTFAAHLRKATADDQSDAFAGSRAFVDAVRCAMVQTRMGDTERSLAVVKTNFKQPDGPMVLRLVASPRQESPDDPPGIEWRTANGEDRAAVIAATKRGASPMVPADAVLGLLTADHQSLEEVARLGKRTLVAVPGATVSGIKDALLALVADGRAYRGEGLRGRVTIGLVPAQGADSASSRAAAAWLANPQASVREIADAAGCSTGLAFKAKPKVFTQGVHSTTGGPSEQWTPPMNKAEASVHSLSARSVGAAGGSEQWTAAGTDDEDAFEHAPLVDRVRL